MENTSFFPTSNLTSDGSEYDEQNLTCDTFVGRIVEIKPLKSNKTKSLFGVIKIEVAGQPGTFQDFLHFSPDKAQGSLAFLVSHCKSAILASGNQYSDGEKNMQWVEASYKKLMDTKAELKFQQIRTERGYEIRYIPTVPQSTGF